MASPDGTKGPFLLTENSTSTATYLVTESPVPVSPLAPQESDPSPPSSTGSGSLEALLSISTPPLNAPIVAQQPPSSTSSGSPEALPPISTPPLNAPIVAQQPPRKIIVPVVYPQGVEASRTRGDSESSTFRHLNYHPPPRNLAPQDAEDIQEDDNDGREVGGCCGLLKNMCLKISSILKHSYSRVPAEEDSGDISGQESGGSNDGSLGGNEENGTNENRETSLLGYPLDDSSSGETYVGHGYGYQSAGPLSRIYPVLSTLRRSDNAVYTGSGSSKNSPLNSHENIRPPRQHNSPLTDTTHQSNKPHRHYNGPLIDSAAEDADDEDSSDQATSDSTD